MSIYLYWNDCNGDEPRGSNGGRDGGRDGGSFEGDVEEYVMRRSFDEMPRALVLGDPAMAK
ncbi:hypothetical protein TWF506_005161 [Arthrobotrys conoides]|uniref:Uncharacterized protein n=1 Tax=Arthrobotrys conoides TaxID=74498 RepID=A0AAN8P622_9PEZI